MSRSKHGREKRRADFSRLISFVIASQRKIRNVKIFRSKWQKPWSLSNRIHGSINIEVTMSIDGLNWAGIRRNLLNLKRSLQEWLKYICLRPWWMLLPTSPLKLGRRLINPHARILTTLNPPPPSSVLFQTLPYLEVCNLLICIWTIFVMKFRD